MSEPDAGEIVALLQTYRGEREVTVPIDKTPFIMGREPGVDICILQDPKVSRKHCHIIESQGTFFIEDTGSSNGTFVNDLRVRETVELQNNDKITLGGKVFIFLLERRLAASTVAITKQKLEFCSKCQGSIFKRQKPLFCIALISSAWHL